MNSTKPEEPLTGEVTDEEGTEHRPEAPAQLCPSSKLQETCSSCPEINHSTVGTAEPPGPKSALSRTALGVEAAGGALGPGRPGPTPPLGSRVGSPERTVRTTRRCQRLGRGRPGASANQRRSNPRSPSLERSDPRIPASNIRGPEALTTRSAWTRQPRAAGGRDIIPAPPVGALAPPGSARLASHFPPHARPRPRPREEPEQPPPPPPQPPPARPGRRTGPRAAASARELAMAAGAAP
ncbi:hypothetical protein J1605_000593 [Eschrichtius robustus]|uniref:Basic proline-rich protein-like n=1 Tax=Eschrichtius robustus TaxID=9764 RepID=A0AB34GW27_ESCRO|nr:hypothetical protein J1605_000593 [Eschrichtius robustus]